MNGCTCANVRAWRRSYSAPWLSVLFTLCWPCGQLWRARMHIAGVAFCYLIAPAAVLALMTGLWLAVRQ